jgi:hypothetical protein
MIISQTSQGSDMSLSTPCNGLYTLVHSLQNCLLDREGTAISSIHRDEGTRIQTPRSFDTSVTFRRVFNSIMPLGLAHSLLAIAILN